jgi:hypothetical protein
LFDVGFSVDERAWRARVGAAEWPELGVIGAELWGLEMPVPLVARAGQVLGPHVRRLAELLIEAPAHVREEGDALLLEWWRGPHPSACVFACRNRALAGSESVERFMEPLAASLVENLSSAHVALLALARFHRRDALGHVLDHAERHPTSPGVLHAILRARALDHEAERVERYLRPLTAHANAVFRARADWGLAKLGDEAAYARLVEGERSADADEREVAAEALAALLD